MRGGATRTGQYFLVICIAFIVRPHATTIRTTPATPLVSVSCRSAAMQFDLEAAQVRPLHHLPGQQQEPQHCACTGHATAWLSFGGVTGRYSGHCIAVPGLHSWNHAPSAKTLVSSRLLERQALQNLSASHACRIRNSNTPDIDVMEKALLL